MVSYLDQSFLQSGDYTQIKATGALLKGLLHSGAVSSAANKAARSTNLAKR